MLHIVHHVTYHVTFTHINEDDICLWLLTGRLQRHSFTWTTCPLLEHEIEEVNDSVSYVASIFNVVFRCVEIQLEILVT